MRDIIDYTLLFRIKLTYNSRNSILYFLTSYRVTYLKQTNKQTKQFTTMITDTHKYLKKKIILEQDLQERIQMHQDT